MLITKRQFTKLILIINTAIQNQVSVFLTDGVKIIKKTAKIPAEKSLHLIDELLKKNKIKIDNIKGIAVVSGPGSFTAVRFGIVIANVLGFIFKIPVVGIKLNEFKNDQELVKIAFKKLNKAKIGKIVLPFYGKEPNITKPHE
jgi:tRNA A37 threonylcarbamoyladenosine modification protein TsaB